MLYFALSEGVWQQSFKELKGGASGELHTAAFVSSSSCIFQLKPQIYQTSHISARIHKKYLFNIFAHL